MSSTAQRSILVGLNGGQQEDCTQSSLVHSPGGAVDWNNGKASHATTIMRANVKRAE